ncbi:DivIVA domain-containing protein [Mesomycoplasma moatsii]|uniref:DivIVA domain-containing protein n=1 Tax=Mesomycoplasma moatsii TaxID=171287 RepID=UPI0003B64E92
MTIKENIKKILDKKFDSVINGYSPSNVDSFLDSIINDLENIEKTIEKLNSEKENQTKTIEELNKEILKITKENIELKSRLEEIEESKKDE